MEIVYINDSSDLNLLVKSILERNIKVIGLDFEGESNLHRYGFHLCLIQLCDGEKIYLIDPMVISDISELQNVFENRSIIKIMCACDFDIKLLKETKGFGINNIFDVHYGAKALGLEKLSLQSITETYLGIELDKSRKKQKSNWNIRPIRNSMLNYAADDVRYLIEIKEVISARLSVENKIKDFEQKCLSLEKLELPKDKPPHLTVKGVGLLSRKEKFIFKDLYYAREHIAKRIDKPVYQVIPNAVLFEISRYAPDSESEWQKFESKYRSVQKYKTMLRSVVSKSLKKLK